MGLAYRRTLIQFTRLVGLNGRMGSCWYRFLVCSPYGEKFPLCNFLVVVVGENNPCVREDNYRALTCTGPPHSSDAVEIYAPWQQVSSVVFDAV